jgi:putative chitinase
MKYFTLYEFVRSEKADKLGIDNLPNYYQIKNCNELVDNLLDPLREAWTKYCEIWHLGTPAIYVSSGIRSEELNDAVGGSKTSAHYHGWAADLIPRNGRLKEFKKFCIEWLIDKAFDQFISENEDEDNIPQWIHIGYKNGTGKQRQQFLYMKNGRYYYLSELLDGDYL